MASGQSTFNADTFKPQIQKDYSLGPEGADAEHKYNLIVDKINSLNIPSPGEAAKSNLNFIIPAIGLGLIVFGILIPKKRRQ